MKYLKFLLIVLALGFFLYYYFWVYNPQSRVLAPAEQSAQSTTAPLKQTEPKQWETKSDDQPPVVVAITPVEFGEDAEQWRFIVVFDTHSGSLDQDPAQAISLVDDNGNVYQPVAWEGPGPGGHHREGAIIFNPIEPRPKYIELKIKNVGGVVERSFQWSLE